VDRLSIREGDHDEKRRDHRADGSDQPQRAGTCQDQDAEDFFGGVGDGRQRIRREHGEAGDLGQALTMGQAGRKLPPDEGALDGVQQGQLGQEGTSAPGIGRRFQVSQADLRIPSRTAAPT
jgi:hypothetical protein